jgi:hypothetical protein
LGAEAQAWEVACGQVEALVVFCLAAKAVLA